MIIFKSNLQKLWTYSQRKVILAAICAHSVSISIGFCQAYSAILIPQLLRSDDIPIDIEQSSWIASFGAITNPIGSILSGVLAEILGRKRSIQISSLPFVAGWLCIAFAEDITWLYTGRLITGIAAGMATASYTYVSEISLPQSRGILQALGPVSASIGILSTYVLGYYLPWNIIAFITLIFSVLTVISMQFLPESPAYLFKKGENKAGLESLLWLRGHMGYSEYLSMLSEKKAKDNEKEGTKSLYLSAVTIKPFFLLVVIFMLQELSGIYSILFYTISFFEKANMDVNQYIVSIIVGVLRLIMSIVAAILINLVGRKKLLSLSSLGMFLSLSAAAIYLKVFEINTDLANIAPALPLVCILFSIVLSMIGMLPIPWILVGELFPIEVRSILSGVVICMAQIFIFVTVKIYPDMIAHLGFSGTLIVFLSAAFLQMIFVKVFLPETRNMSLQKINDCFKKNNKDSENINNNNNNINNFAYKDAGFRYGKNVFTVTI